MADLVVYANRFLRQPRRVAPTGYILPDMDPGPALRTARTAAGLSQAALALRAGTSQATLSAYENGRKRPSVETLSRVLAAAGARLTVEQERAPSAEPSEARKARNGAALLEVLSLAEALPTRHDPVLRYPRLVQSRPG